MKWHYNTSFIGALADFHTLLLVEINVIERLEESGYVMKKI